MKIDKELKDFKKMLEGFYKFWISIDVYKIIVWCTLFFACLIFWKGIIVFIW